jgi:ADP-heptose:LPS heptosyltransferase
MRSKNIIGLWMTHGLGDVVMSIPVICHLANNKNNDIYVFVQTSLVKSLIVELISFKNVYCFVIEKKISFILKVAFTKYSEFYFIHSEDKLKYMILYLAVHSKKKVVCRFDCCFLGKIFRGGIVRKVNEHKVNYFGRYVDMQKLNEYPEVFSVNTSSYKDDYSVVLAPGCSESLKHKRWPEEYWSTLVDMLCAYKDVTIYIVGSYDEQELIDKIIKDKILSLQLNKVVLLSIKQTIELIKRTDLVIAVCNGTSHIASLLSVPVIGLYGPTDPQYTGVFSKNSVIIKSDTDCSPCFTSNNITGCLDINCMKSIPPLRVYSEFLKYYYNFSTKSNFKFDE